MIHDKSQPSIVDAVTDELLAHGEFSSTNNNRPNAKIAAEAVIKIVLAHTTNAALRTRTADAVAGVGEAVAWRHRHGTGRWRYSDEAPDGPSIHLFEVQALYASPPAAPQAGQQFQATSAETLHMDDGREAQND